MSSLLVIRRLSTCHFRSPGIKERKPCSCFLDSSSVFSWFVLRISQEETHSFSKWFLQPSSAPPVRKRSTLSQSAGQRKLFSSASLSSPFSCRHNTKTSSTQPLLPEVAPEVTNDHSTSSQASLSSLKFWSSIDVWKRSSNNTLRCLTGCSLGDFSALFYLQAHHPELGTQFAMPIAMTCGVATSILLETLILRFGKDFLSWRHSFRTATGMSLLSMLTMEAIENFVGIHLTGGVIAIHDPTFWFSAFISLLGGFLAPLPLNYYQLKKHGKACH